MKKLVILLSLVIFSTSISACSSDNVSQTEPSASQVSETTVGTNANEPTTEEVNLVDVPEVVGLSLNDATEKLTDAGLKVDLILASSETVQADYVISQSPVAGGKAKENDSVTIYVSKSGSSQNSQSSQSSVSTDTLYCCASDYATLRDKNSRSGNELAKIYSRESVERIGTTGEFYYVSYKGQKGYVLKDFFSTSANAPLNYGTGNASSSDSYVLYCRASDYATLRASASRSSKELAKVYCRESVYCYGSSGEFYYVTYRGQSGYVLKTYFSTDPNASLNYGLN